MSNFTNFYLTFFFEIFTFLYFVDFKELLLSSLQEDEEFLRQVRELLFPPTPAVTTETTSSGDEKSSEPKSDL